MKWFFFPKIRFVDDRLAVDFEVREKNHFSISTIHASKLYCPLRNGMFKVPVQQYHSVSLANGKWFLFSSRLQCWMLNAKMFKQGKVENNDFSAFLLSLYRFVNSLELLAVACCVIFHTNIFHFYFILCFNTFSHHSSFIMYICFASVRKTDLPVVTFFVRI